MKWTFFGGSTQEKTLAAPVSILFARVTFALLIDNCSIPTTSTLEGAMFEQFYEHIMRSTKREDTNQITDQTLLEAFGVHRMTPVVPPKMENTAYTVAPVRL